MSIQPGTFKRLPSKEEILTLVEEEKQHNADITSYLWYVIPLAERFGRQVYSVAAESLRSGGLEITASRLEELAKTLKTPEGMKRYEKQRRRHLQRVTG